MYQFWIMELRGEIKEVLPDRVKVIDSGKKQVIDVFYMARNEAFVTRLFPREQVEFSIALQSVEVKGINLTKVWLIYVIYPRPVVPSLHRGKDGGERNWADSKNK